MALVPREELIPLLLAHLIHPIIRDFVDRAYVIEVFLSIIVVRVPRFGGCRTVGLGQLTQRARKERHAIQEQ